MTVWELTQHRGEVGMAQPLADAGIPILAQSTFDTDWILVPTGQADQALQAWRTGGHTIDIEEAE